MAKSTVNCDRRDLLKMAGIGAAAFAIPAMGIITNANATASEQIGKEIVETDVLVIGGGVAATFAALSAKKQGMDVTMVDKGTVGKSGLSPFFGAYNVYDSAKSCSRKQWIAQKMEGSEYLDHHEYFEMFFEDSKDRYNDLKSWGCAKPHPKGHAWRFREKVEEAGVQLIERTMAVELIKKDGRIAGAAGFSLDEEKIVIVNAKAVILCSGAGALRGNGFPIGPMTHDGDCMAYRIGAEISGKEFNDGHITHYENPADYWGNWGNHWGGGLHLDHNPHGGGLSISANISAHEGNVPYLMDTPSDMKAGSPPAGGKMGEAPPGPPGGRPPGVRDMKLPIVSGSTTGMADHKCEGIFPQDAKCSSNIPGLYAAGDALCSGGAAYTGIGGSSSNSAVQGGRAGIYASDYAKTVSMVKITTKDIAAVKDRTFAPLQAEKGYNPDWVLQVLRGTMVPYFCLFVKKEDRLQSALTTVEFIRDHFLPHLLAPDLHELRNAQQLKNMVLNSEMKLRAGLARKESRGSHYREDYPARDDANFLAWIVISQGKDGRMQLVKREVPKSNHPDPSLPYEKKYPFRYPGELEFLKSRA